MIDQLEKARVLLAENARFLEANQDKDLNLEDLQGVLDDIDKARDLVRLRIYDLEDGEE